MRNIEYNLDNMSHFKSIFFIVMFFTVLSHMAFAEDLKDKDAEVVGTVRDTDSSWYAIARIDGKKSKLYTIGDIFYSDSDITKCVRIEDIKKDILILESVEVKGTIIVRPGERIPLEGTEIIFEKTIEADVLEYRYKNSKTPISNEGSDFSIKDFNGEKIVLEKDYDSDAPREEIKAGLFEDIEITRLGDDVWSVDKESSRLAFANAGNTLLSVIKQVQPSFRFGQGTSLKFNCEFGDLVLDRSGFLVENLAVAEIAGRAGIRQGDLIKSINGYPVNSLYGMYKAYMAVRSDTEIKMVSIDIIREGKPRTLFYNIR